LDGKPVALSPSGPKRHLQFVRVNLRSPPRVKVPSYMLIGMLPRKPFSQNDSSIQPRIDRYNHKTATDIPRYRVRALDLGASIAAKKHSQRGSSKHSAVAEDRSARDFSVARHVQKRTLARNTPRPQDRCCEGLLRTRMAPKKVSLRVEAVRSTSVSKDDSIEVPPLI
jgi:hypothetical protein